MADYVADLTEDLAEQFRGKPHILALVNAVGRQLQEVYDFFLQLQVERSLTTATGIQLDNVGDIVGLTRKEAGLLSGEPIETIDDATYRKYLIWKILVNTCDCTYTDILKALGYFWDGPLYYTEDPEQPATMIFDTEDVTEDTDVSELFTFPILRAAGVKLVLNINHKAAEFEDSIVYAGGNLGYSVTISPMPESD